MATPCKGFFKSISKCFLAAVAAPCYIVYGAARSGTVQAVAKASIDVLLLPVRLYSEPREADPAESSTTVRVFRHLKADAERFGPAAAAATVTFSLAPALAPTAMALLLARTLGPKATVTTLTVCNLFTPFAPIATAALSVGVLASSKASPKTIALMKDTAKATEARIIDTLLPNSPFVQYGRLIFSNSSKSFSQIGVGVLTGTYTETSPVTFANAQMQTAANSVASVAQEWTAAQLGKIEDDPLIKLLKTKVVQVFRVNQAFADLKRGVQTSTTAHVFATMNGLVTTVNQQLIRFVSTVQLNPLNPPASEFQFNTFIEQLHRGDYLQNGQSFRGALCTSVQYGTELLKPQIQRHARNHVRSWIKTADHAQVAQFFKERFGARFDFNAFKLDLEHIVLRSTDDRIESAVTSVSNALQQHILHPAPPSNVVQIEEVEPAYEPKSQTVTGLFQNAISAQGPYRREYDPVSTKKYELIGLATAVSFIAAGAFALYAQTIPALAFFVGTLFIGQAILEFSSNESRKIQSPTLLDTVLDKVFSTPAQGIANKLFVNAPIFNWIYNTRVFKDPMTKLIDRGAVWFWNLPGHVTLEQMNTYLNSTISSIVLTLAGSVFMTFGLAFRAWQLGQISTPLLLVAGVIAQHLAAVLLNARQMLNCTSVEDLVNCVGTIGNLIPRVLPKLVQPVPQAPQAQQLS